VKENQETQDWSKVLTYDQAAELVEKDIEEAYKRTAAAKKFAAKENKKTEQAEEKSSTPKVTPIGPTLSKENSVKTAPVTPSRKSDEQLQKELAAKLQSQLTPSSKKETVQERYDRIQAEKAAKLQSA